MVPYKYVPKDFIPPEKWIGSFSKGQFTQYIMAIFLFPVPFVLGASLAFLDIPSDIAATVCAILLLAIAVLAALPVGDVCLHTEKPVFHLPHSLVCGNGWLILWLKMVILVVAPQSRLLIRAE